MVLSDSCRTIGDSLGIWFEDGSWIYCFGLEHNLNCIYDCEFLPFREGDAYYTYQYCLCCFTGIGTAGTAITGILFLDEGASFLKIFSLLILIGGIIGLKLSDKPKATEGKEGKP